MTGADKRNIAEELGDAEAYELFSRIRSPFDKSAFAGATRDEVVRISKNLPEQPFGRKFRASYDYFRFNEAKIDSWSSPPEQHRLTIDENIDQLIARSSRPFIRKGSSKYDSILSYSGPYFLSRLHLWSAAGGHRHPRMERARLARADQFVSQIDDVSAALTSILTRSEWFEVGRQLTRQEREHMYSDDMATCTSRDTAIEDAVASCHEEIRKTIHTLQHLRNVAAAERAAVRVRATGPGRPKRYWSVSFIEAMAYLWQLLTGEVASRSDDSLFGEFVYSAWNSYDDAMPEVSFAHALRNSALTKSRRK